MDAPNKIYLSKLVMAGVEILDKPVSDDDVEYIRKDALLKWLENKVSLSYGVATDALVEVIDKLNSL